MPLGALENPHVYGDGEWRGGDPLEKGFGCRNRRKRKSLWRGMRRGWSSRQFIVWLSDLLFKLNELLLGLN
jgi:hypothetical protein